MRYRLFIVIVLAAGLNLLPFASAYAACANPAYEEGAVIYSSVYHMPEYCNGTQWIPFGILNPAAGGPGCSNPAGDEGTVLYNGNYHVLQYCDGDDWRAVGIGTIGGAPHIAMNFVDQTGIALSTVIESNIELYDSTGGGASVTISGDGSPAYRICADATCSGAPAYTSAAGMVSDGDYLQLRLTSSPASLTTFTGTLGIGIVSYNWDVTTTGNRIVFVTSQTYTGLTIGGYAAATTKCQTLASAAGLLGTYKAWIATSAANDPESTFTQSTYDYQLLDGTVIANGWADLTDGIIDNFIDRDENNNAVAAINVWTNVQTNGTYKGTTDCTGWTDTAGSGEKGTTAQTDNRWTDAGSTNCGSSNRLYCFEQ